MVRTRILGLTVLALAATAAQAQAAEMSMKLKQSKVKQGGSVEMTLTGRADENGDVQVYRQIGGHSCAKTSQEQLDRAKSRYVVGLSVDVGASSDFTLKKKIRLAADGKYVICAYLGAAVDQAPAATASAKATATKD